MPFISRYRKEATGGLDDTQLRLLEERLRYLRELEERRAAIIASITEQGKMTPELLKAVSLATDKTHLEDLYLPYKPKRRTKAQIALEAGLEPLADALLANPMLNPEEEAAKYLREPFTSEAGEQSRRGGYQGGAGWRAADFDGALCRRCRPAAIAARICAGTRRGAVQSAGRQERRGGKVCRLFRLFRIHQHHSFAPRAGGVPRPARRDAECAAAPG